MRAFTLALMTLLGIAPGEAQRVASSTTDFIDSDSTPLPAGSEGSGSATAANLMMADASELRAVAGVTPSHFAVLERWLCALPIAEPAPINVNTLLPEQAPLLAALAPGVIDVGRARFAIAARPADGFGSVLNFWNSPALAGVEVPQDVAQQVKLRSAFFSFRATVTNGETEVEERALIDARSLPARIVSRSWGEAG